MKTIEQKALAYDEAIERGKRMFSEKELNYLFPELQESRDERIRKEIIKYIKTGTYHKDWITWLEKQKTIDVLDKEEREFADNVDSYRKDMDEFYKKGYNAGREDAIEDTCNWLSQQGDMLEDCFSDVKDFVDLYKEAVGGGEKPRGKKVDNANKVEPKFHESEWIVWENQYYKVNYNGCGYELVDQNGLKTSLEYGTVDENAHLWDITKDAKDGDLIYVGTEEKGIQAIFHEYKNGTIFFYCYLCGDFAQGGYMPIGSIELAYPLQKIHYNRFFQKMKEAGYEWNAEKKELKKIVPKFKIEKGKWYVCIKDLLDNYANKAFYKGDTYLSTRDGTLIPCNSNIPFYVEICSDMYFREWTIEDVKDGDILVSGFNKPFIYNGKHNSILVGAYGGITTMDKFMNASEECRWTENVNIHPANKDQRDILMKAMNDEGYVFDFNKKELIHEYVYSN